GRPGCCRGHAPGAVGCRAALRGDRDPRGGVVREALPVADGAQVRRYAGTLLRRHPRLLGWTLGLHGLAAVSGLVAPRLLGDLVESIERGTGAVTVDRIALVIGLFVVVQSVLTRYAKYTSAQFGERMLAELREEFVERVLSLPLSTVER